MNQDSRGGGIVVMHGGVTVLKAGLQVGEERLTTKQSATSRKTAKE